MRSHAHEGTCGFASSGNPLPPICISIPSHVPSVGTLTLLLGLLKIERLPGGRGTVCVVAESHRAAAASHLPALQRSSCAQISAGDINVPPGAGC